MMSSRFSQLEDSRQISVSIILKSHNLSQPIIIVALDQKSTEGEMRDIVKVPTENEKVSVF